MKRLIEIGFCLLIFIQCGCPSMQDIVYTEKLEAAKKYYPFAQWREADGRGLDAYTRENCDKCQKIFDDLIENLITIGRDAAEEDKVAFFKKAILATNKLDEATDHGLIETDEREQLCELTDKITEACGLDPSKYGNKEGLCSEWREW